MKLPDIDGEWEFSQGVLEHNRPAHELRIYKRISPAKKSLYERFLELWTQPQDWRSSPPMELLCRHIEQLEKRVEDMSNALQLQQAWIARQK